MIPQNWGLSVGGGRWDAQNTIEGDLFGIIFFAAIVNMRIFVYFCQDVLVHIFGHNWVGEQEGFVTPIAIRISDPIPCNNLLVPQWGRQPPAPDLHHRLSSWGNLLDPFWNEAGRLATLQPSNPEKELITYPQELNWGLHQAEYSNLPMWSALANGRSSRCCKILDINFLKGHPTISGAQILRKKSYLQKLVHCYRKEDHKNPPLMRNSAL